MWLWHLAYGEAPSLREIGDAVGRTGPAVSAWRFKAEFPGKSTAGTALADFFGVVGAERAWLIDGAGDAPDPQLFALWENARKIDAQKLRPEQLPLECEARAPKTKGKGKRAKDARRAAGSR